jgi:cytochrome c553
VVDAKGRGIQTHLNWIQVRPGERRTCDGCHSPRRGGAINSGDVVNTLPPALLPGLAGQHRSGETMAALRTRLDATLLRLKPDMEFSDVWADTSKPGVAARAPIVVRYTGNADPAQDLATPAPVNGLINYPQHIQPIWSRDRGANTCTGCHADSAKLDLRGTTAGTGRLVSYEELMLGDPLIDPGTGRPLTRLREGVPEVVRGAPLVETMGGNATGHARSSRLTEILFNETLKASGESRTAHPQPPISAPDHSTLLNAAEKRLVVEWMDLGGQYYNNPFDGGIRAISTLSQASFESQVMPVLQTRCASCHAPSGSVAGSSTPPRQNRFVLTGSAEGDYNVTLSMISNTCSADSNYLLSRPSSVPHPLGASGQLSALLPVGSTHYNAIAAWIGTGCPTP